MAEVSSHHTDAPKATPEEMRGGGKNQVRRTGVEQHTACDHLSR